MHRLPLADKLPYRFCPPRPDPFWIWATRGLRRRMLRRDYRIVGIDAEGLDRLRPLFDRGDGVMLTSNHPGRADGLVMLELADRLGQAFCAMAAYQIFDGRAGVRQWLFPRLGVFPVDREGSDRAAFKAAVEAMAGARHPLLIFPEGEVYYTADRLTPLRDGAAAIALAASKKLAASGKGAWIVPMALKYRFSDGFDPGPGFLAVMDRIESRLTWRPRVEMPLVGRIYRFAAALLTLKELEYLGEARPGTLRERIADLRSHLLGTLEERRRGGRHESDPPPVRIKELRRACLDALANPETTADEARALRRDLDEVFLAVQAFSYPGDYVDEHPTVDRVAETLAKLEEDLLLGNDYARPPGPRRAVVRVGEPIDVAALSAAGGKARASASALTSEMERRIQALLDEIGPGRPLEEVSVPCC